MEKKWKDDDGYCRLVVFNTDEKGDYKWKPKKCKQEWFKTCPVNKTGKKWIEVEKTSKIWLISENLWIGCGMCVKNVHLMLLI